MNIFEIDNEILKLKKLRKELEKKEIKEFQEKAKLNIGRCFIVDDKYLMIIDIPKKFWDKNGNCHFNQYQYQALYLGYEEENPPIVPFYYDTVFSDILGETKSIFYKNCKEISKEEYLLEFDRLVYELRNKVKKAMNPCCKNCYFLSKDNERNIQLCTKKKIPTENENYCSKWMSR